MNTAASRFFAANGVVTSNDLMGFMGSFFNSLIARILTLGGVYLTIKDQRFSRILEKLPGMLLEINKIKEVLHYKEIYGILNSIEDYSTGEFLEGNSLDGI